MGQCGWYGAEYRRANALFADPGAGFTGGTFCGVPSDYAARLLILSFHAPLRKSAAPEASFAESCVHAGFGEAREGRAIFLYYRFLARSAPRLKTFPSDGFKNMISQFTLKYSQGIMILCQIY